MTDNKPEDKSQSTSDKRMHISIGGNVGPGAIVGTGSTEGKYIAGRDIRDITVVSEKEAAGKTREDFSGLLTDLRVLIEKAQEAGELGEEAATAALGHMDAAAEIVTQEKPSKRGLMRKLEDVGEILDAAADTIESAGGAARVLLHALPVTSLLLNLISYIF